MTADVSRFDRGSALLKASAVLRPRGRPPIAPHIAATIENEIVPRLVARRLAAEIGAAPVDVQDVLDLAAFAIAHDGEATRHYVLGLAVGRSFESVCHDLAAPAARHLGALWEEDFCSFTDVTLGMLHLQHALHGLAGAGRVAPEGFRRRRVLLALAPGEQHGFGLQMVEEFFLRAGWQVLSLAGADMDEVMRALRSEWFGVMGFSAGGIVRAEMLPGVIARARAASRNESLAVMVGGPAFAAQPELAREVGADGTAADGTQAVWLAENLLGARKVAA